MERLEIIRRNDRLSLEYRGLIEEFIHVGFEDAKMKDVEGVRCPCKDCKNNAYYDDAMVLREHLYCRGFDPKYTVWIWHGEVVVDKIIPEIDVGSEDMEYDAYLGEMVEDVAREFVNKPSVLTAMMNDKETPLYKGSRHCIMAATLLMMNLKAKHGITDKGMTELFGIVKELLPVDNLLPDKVYAAKKILCPMGMELEKIHACPNDCMLYRSVEEKKLNNCLVCGESRYKVKDKELIKVGDEESTFSDKKTPAKVMWYLPIVPRLKRLFANPDDAKLFTWHAERERGGDDIISHASDGEQWKKMDELYPEFGKEPRNLRLGLSTDGMNPFGNLSSTHSSWPVMLVIYNLPSWLMMKRKYVLLSMMISGPKQPGNDIDVYLAPLIEDLRSLFNSGVSIADGSRGDEKFELKGMLMWTINDFPALGNLKGYSVKGHLACPICEKNTSHCQLKNGGKTVYLGHRRFLPEDHPWRFAKKWFNGKIETDPEPIPPTGVEILQTMEKLGHVYGKKEKVAKNSGSWKKRSIFFDLPYWKYLEVTHCLDVMHIEKNVCDALVGTLLNTPGKTKDGLKSRLDLVSLGIRPSLAPVEEGDKSYLPPACYTMSTKEKESFCNTLKSVKVPTGYSSNIRSCVQLKELKLAGMKSHDCHNLMQELNVIAIRGSLPMHVRNAITKLCYFFKAICRKSLSHRRLDKLQRMVVEVLCRLEMYFPPSFFDIMVHLIVHLVREIKLCGPVFLRWMYPFERYMKIFKLFVKNRYRPDASIVQRYVAEEVIEFCTNYLKDVDTIGVPNSRHESRLDGHGLRHNRMFQPSADDLIKAHVYVLRNHKEIAPYVDIHMKELLEANSGLTEEGLLDEHNRTFACWLQNHVESGVHSETVKWLSRRPLGTVRSFGGYDINGYTFGTKDMDDNGVSQNSGVSNISDSLEDGTLKKKMFFGTITDIWELDYVKLRIAVFKCIWVDERRGIKHEGLGMTLVDRARQGSKEDPFILAVQADQVFYVTDPVDPRWEVVVGGKKSFVDDEMREHDDMTDENSPLDFLLHEDKLLEDEVSLKRYIARVDHDEGIWVTNTGKVSKRKRKNPMKKK